jgi:hypothetical protein
LNDHAAGIASAHELYTHSQHATQQKQHRSYVNIVELVGLSVAQIIASASNFYSLGTGLSKRCVSFGEAEGGGGG